MNVSVGQLLVYLCPSLLVATEGSLHLRTFPESWGMTYIERLGQISADEVSIPRCTT